MFRCTDCGEEFEIKPEYCNCGNNVFEEVVNTPHPEIKKAEEPKSEPPEEEKITAIKKYHESEKRTAPSVDMPSLIIFLVCIILAILSVIYIGKDSIEQIDKTNSEKHPAQNVKNPNIPSIDKIWISTKPKVKTQQQIKQNVVAATIPQSQPVAQPVTIKTMQQPVQKQSNPIQTTVVKSVQKQTAKQQKVQPKKQISQPIQTIPKTNNISKPTSTGKKTVTNASKVSPTNNNVNSYQQLAQYKISLRNEIGNKINFTKVIGDGYCVVTFNLDSSGNLLNRKFTVESDNDTLNNAVYQAVKNTVSFQSPPTSYKGETFTLSVKMRGGNFNVMLN